VIGIDAMVLIYAGLAPRTSGGSSKKLDDLSVRAKILLHMCSKQTVIIPAIAVSEILVPVPEKQRGILIARLSDRFLCAPFDLKALPQNSWVKSVTNSGSLSTDSSSLLPYEAAWPLTQG